jgi:tetratricopeptide (TPR) repeat protein
LERYDSAAEMAQQAEASLRFLVEIDRSNVGPRRSLASASGLLGRIRAAQGRTDEAVAAYEAANELFVVLKNEHPHSTKYLNSLAYTHRCLAEATEARGETARALSLLEEACRLHEESARWHGEVAAQAFNRAMAYYRLGKWHKRFGDPHAAISEFDRAKRLLETLVCDNPSWAQPTEKLAETCFHQSELWQRKLRRPRKALLAYEQGVENRRRLVEQLQPQDPKLREQLAHEIAYLTALRSRLVDDTLSVIAD